MKLIKRLIIWIGLLALGVELMVIDFSQVGLHPVIPSLIDFPELELSRYHRLLVLAPHCDDETLGSGGLIQAALALNLEVRVVIATNGDGYLFATLGQFRHFYPHRGDFIKMGNIRQKESLAALRTLGLSDEQTIFLSYPDRGTAELWNNHWDLSDPYRSPFTGATSSPYPLTFDEEANYTGESYLADLIKILDEYQPDIIVIPHPEDLHPDHWGLSAFARLAIAWGNHRDPGYDPDVYTYLIHRSDFPQPRGYQPQASLLPPASVYSVFRDWFRLSLTTLEEEKKEQATGEYKSQLPLLHNLMQGFIRENELFGRLPKVQLPHRSQGDINNPETWFDEAGSLIEPIQRDPVGDFFTRKAVPAADLVSIFASSGPEGNLAVCAMARLRPEPALVYNLRVTAISDTDTRQMVASNATLKPGWLRAQTVGRFVCAKFSADNLGNPWLLFVGAEVKELGVSIIDQVAWQMIGLPSATPR